MDELPRPARLYVGGVIAIGLTLMVLRLPDAKFAQPVLFLALLILSSMTAALKVHLPLTTSGSTMSVSYAVDFASLLLLGPHETMLVAAHPDDLLGAQRAGLKTAYVPRLLEHGPKPLVPPPAGAKFDYTANDFLDLARQLGA